MKIATACVTAGLLLVAVPSAMASPGDFSNGGGQVFMTNISFSAHEDKKGDVKGHINATAVGSRTSYRAEVTCLTVAGDRAVIGGVMESNDGGFSSPFPPGSGVRYHVQDNGQPSDGPDQISVEFLPAPPQDCDIAPLRQLSPMERGNILVRDVVE